MGLGLGLGLGSTLCFGNVRYVILVDQNAVRGAGDAFG